MSRQTDPFAGDPAGPGAVANAHGGELIADSWKLKCPKEEEAKSKPYAHEVVLVGEELAIVRAGRAARRRARPTTAISPAPATIRSSSSTRTAISNGVRSGRAKCTAPTAGARCSTRWSRYRGQTLRRFLRGDAAFALPDVYEYLEAEGFQYTIRLPANQVLQAQIAPLLTRPVGRPPHYVRRFYASFRYQARSWCRARRVVAKVEWHPAGSTRASASSSRTSAAQPGGSSPSTTRAGQRSSGSKKGSTRSSGRGCRARPSGQRGAPHSTLWPTLANFLRARPAGGRTWSLTACGRRW